MRFLSILLLLGPLFAQQSDQSAQTPAQEKAAQEPAKTDEKTAAQAPAKAGEKPASPAPST